MFFLYENKLKIIYTVSIRYTSDNEIAQSVIINYYTVIHYTTCKLRLH